jgi:hypothetical protein
MPGSGLGLLQRAALLSRCSLWFAFTGIWSAAVCRQCRCAVDVIHSVRHSFRFSQVLRRFARVAGFQSNRARADVVHGVCNTPNILTKVINRLIYLFARPRIGPVSTSELASGSEALLWGLASDLRSFSSLIRSK